MKPIVVRFAVMAALSACLSVNGEHTDNEKMDVARTCLLRAMAIHARGLRYRESNDGAYPDTWRGFLGQCNQEWSLAEKKAAFDLYLRAMSTNNCTMMTPMDQNLVRTAVVQCELLDYTNAIPHLMALVLNSKGIHKTMAINYILKASPVSEHVTDFVETIMTNSNVFTKREQVYAVGLYAEKVCNATTAGGSDILQVQNTARMFYRNRMYGATSPAAVDGVLTSGIPGFGMSSNRLDMAMSILSDTNTLPVFIEYFSSVTNQLLSSGQPLPWINVGEGGN